MSSLLDCLSDCQPKVRSDLMSFLNITSNELAQEMALLREVGLNIQEENELICMQKNGSHISIYVYRFYILFVL